MKFQRKEENQLKKLIKNSAKIEIKENKLMAIASEVGTLNLNGMILEPESLKFSRETYPLLFEHGDSASDVIGDAKTYYDAERNAYVSEFEVYEENPSIYKAVQNGAYDSVSVSYYLDDYEFVNGGEDILVKSAIFKEISLVSVPADPNAKFIDNSIEEERAAFKLAENELKELKEIKANYE